MFYSVIEALRRPLRIRNVDRKIEDSRTTVSDKKGFQVWRVVQRCIFSGTAFTAIQPCVTIVSNSHDTFDNISFNIRVFKPPTSDYAYPIPHVQRRLADGIMDPSGTILQPSSKWDIWTLECAVVTAIGTNTTKQRGNIVIYGLENVMIRTQEKPTWFGFRVSGNAAR
ncbi:nonribosomal peptide synthetase [Moniliophthora roreri]|nr:nonribosomal peptide synthetase [Moniliophthora roreri]